MTLNIIDLDTEFSLLTDLVHCLWDGCDSDTAKQALKMAFEQGLEDAKLWIDEYATMCIAQRLNGNDEIAFPLRARLDMELDCDTPAMFYDALCLFDSTLSSGLTDIYRSVTRYGRWDYSRQADALCNRISSAFGAIDVAPKDQDSETQKAIASAYAGHEASGPGTLPTPERLLKRVVIYSRDEQGLSLFRNLFSTVYSHALYCAKLKNTQQLVNDLLPIYEKRNEPLNFDNGEAILAAALKNPFVALVHQIKPFTFYSTKHYLEAKERQLALQVEQAKETPEQKQQREDEVNRDICSMLQEIDSELDDEDSKIDRLVDSIAPSIQPIKLK